MFLLCKWDLKDAVDIEVGLGVRISAIEPSVVYAGQERGILQAEPEFGTRGRGWGGRLGERDRVYHGRAGRG